MNSNELDLALMRLSVYAKFTSQGSINPSEANDTLHQWVTSIKRKKQTSRSIHGLCQSAKSIAILKCQYNDCGDGVYRDSDADLCVCACHLMTYQ